MSIMTGSIFQEKGYTNNLQVNQSTTETHQGITGLFLGCQVNTDLWVPVKKMIWNTHTGKANRGYRTACVTGIKQAMATNRLWQNYFGLSPIDRVDITRDIHPAYACRMPLVRPQEMSLHLPNLDLPADLLDPITYVARSGGYRQTDSLDVFPELEPDSDGCYRFFFGLQELNLLDDDSVKQGDILITKGREAIHQKIGRMIGSMPGYIHALVMEQPQNVRLQIERVNDSFYTSQRLLCSATCKGFIPFSSELYSPIGDLYGEA
jgi:hypothetical protein